MHICFSFSVVLSYILHFSVYSAALKKTLAKHLISDTHLSLSVLFHGTSCAFPSTSLKTCMFIIDSEVACMEKLFIYSILYFILAVFLSFFHEAGEHGSSMSLERRCSLSFKSGIYETFLLYLSDRQHINACVSVCFAAAACCLLCYSRQMPKISSHLNMSLFSNKFYKSLTNALLCIVCLIHFS